MKKYFLQATIMWVLTIKLSFSAHIDAKSLIFSFETNINLLAPSSSILFENLDSENIKVLSRFHQKNKNQGNIFHAIAFISEALEQGITIPPSGNMTIHSKLDPIPLSFVTWSSNAKKNTSEIFGYLMIFSEMNKKEILLLRYPNLAEKPEKSIKITLVDEHRKALGKIKESNLNFREISCINESILNAAMKIWLNFIENNEQDPTSWISFSDVLRFQINSITELQVTRPPRAPIPQDQKL